MAYATVDELCGAIVKRLAEPGYATSYHDEAEFEAEVWRRLGTLQGVNREKDCLTSHVKREGRSAAEWKAFCKEACGADVNVLGSNNRLDIVVKHPVRGSLGIEVKCLGKSGHAGKLTQGLGQALLALQNRDFTLLMIHCGTVSAEDRRQLQRVAKKVCAGTRTAIVVVP